MKIKHACARSETEGGCRPSYWFQDEIKFAGKQHDQHTNQKWPNSFMLFFFIFFITKPLSIVNLPPNQSFQWASDINPTTRLQHQTSVPIEVTCPLVCVDAKSSNYPQVSTINSSFCTRARRRDGRAPYLCFLTTFQALPSILINLHLGAQYSPDQ